MELREVRGVGEGIIADEQCSVDHPWALSVCEWSTAFLSTKVFYQTVCSYSTFL